MRPLRRRLVVVGVVAGVLLVVVGLLGVGRASDPTGYGEETRAETVAACTRAGGEEAACSCAYDLLEANLPFGEFVELDDDIVAGADLPEELVELLGPCSRLPS